MGIKHRYNWKPDHPDFRDHKYSLHCALLADLPTSVDLRALCSPIVNQGQEGSCTANALGSGAMEFVQLMDIRDAKNPDGGTVFDHDKLTRVSRQFLYYNERLIEGSVFYDAGAQIRDGVKVLAKFGCCKESTWPYLPSSLTVPPSLAAYQEARKHKIASYLRIESVDEMKHCLAAGFPFVFGFMVYESFETASVAQTGIVPMPKKGEKLLGGHAVCAVGYDDAKQHFIVRNSWGAGWGDQGNFYMPYEYLASSDLCADFWTIRK